MAKKTCVTGTVMLAVLLLHQALVAVVHAGAFFPLAHFRLPTGHSVTVIKRHLPDIISAATTDHDETLPHLNLRTPPSLQRYVPLEPPQEDEHYIHIISAATTDHDETLPHLNLRTPPSLQRYVPLEPPQEDEHYIRELYCLERFHALEVVLSRPENKVQRSTGGDVEVQADIQFLEQVTEAVKNFCDGCVEMYLASAELVLRNLLDSFQNPPKILDTVDYLKELLEQLSKDDFTMLKAEEIEKVFKMSRKQKHLADDNSQQFWKHQFDEDEVEKLDL